MIEFFPRYINDLTVLSLEHENVAHVGGIGIS